MLDESPQGDGSPAAVLLAAFSQLTGCLTLAFGGIRALRQMADFCESYQVRRLRHAGQTWAEIAGRAGVSAQALHKKHAQALRESAAAD